MRPIQEIDRPLRTPRSPSRSLDEVSGDVTLLVAEAVNRVSLLPADDQDYRREDVLSEILGQGAVGIGSIRRGRSPSLVRRDPRSPIEAGNYYPFLCGAINALDSGDTPRATNCLMVARAKFQIHITEVGFGPIGEIIMTAAADKDYPLWPKQRLSDRLRGVGGYYIDRLPKITAVIEDLREMDRLQRALEKPNP